MNDTQRLTLREVQLVELDILKAVIEWFDVHKISYCLCGGSMLGTVRHQGFIPWDDDIDLFVPRDDYERLKELVRQGERPKAHISLGLPGDDSYPYPFIKAMDLNYTFIDEERSDTIPQYVWVDIFPLDHFPDDEREHRRCVNRLVRYNHIISACTLSKDYLRSRGYFSDPIKLCKYLGAMVLFTMMGGARSIAVKTDDYARRMDRRYRASNHVGDGAWPNGMKDYFTVDCLFPVEKHLFEGVYVNIPVNYHGYLSHFYGDYMKLPPVEDRVDHCIQVMRRTNGDREGKK